MSRYTIARSLDAELRKQIMDRIRAGVKYADIAKEFGHPVSPQVISSVKDLDRKPVPTSIPGLYRQGHSGKLLGEQLDARAKPEEYEDPKAIVRRMVRAGRAVVGKPRTGSGAPSLVGSANTKSAKSQPLTAPARLRRLLRKSIPLEERARLLTELAKSEDHRIAIRALSILHELEAEGEAQLEDRSPGPLFVLPKGSLVSVQPYQEPEPEPGS